MTPPMSPSDIIAIPGHPGMFARRVIVDAWQAAGSPPINDAGRLKAKQQDAWDAWQNGTGSPADDPNRPDRFPLAHVRFVALDITPTPERVARLEAAGLVRPYAYESWHWQVRNVYDYPLVTSIPTTAGDGSKPFPAPEEEDIEMPNGFYAKGDKSDAVFWIEVVGLLGGKRRPVLAGELTAAQQFNSATGGKTGAGFVAVMKQATLDAIPYMKQ